NSTTRMPPVIVVSSQVKEADSILLQEMGVSAVLQKPYQDEELIHAFFNAIKSDDQPTAVKQLMHKLKQAVFQGDKATAKEAHSALLQWPELSESHRSTANALWNYIKKDYLAAKDDLLHALKESTNNILLIDLMGKVLLRLNQHEAAIKCFLKATHMSPLNLERLCSTAEICSETGQGKDAQEMLNNAKSVDSESERVVLAESRVAINLGDTESAQNAVNRMGNLSQLIGYMNNRAITMVREGKVEQALTLYDDALKSLPGDRGREKSVVLFNKGLALARLQKVDEAVGVFSEISAEDNADIHKKAGGLSRKIRAMRDAGKEISFSNRADAEDLLLGRPQSLYAIPGQLRLHMLFDSGQFVGDELSRILKPLPELKHS
ncbi:hypothetical protein N9D31_04270, partial [Oligoflexaceae bacterium]|nr:hypothetical protein [Oligoflexaceae bacterium]